MSYCTYCGTQNREGAMFCSNCGKPMSEPQTANADQPTAEHPVVEQPTVKQPADKQPDAYYSQLFEEKPRNNKRVILIILIPVILIIIGIVAGAFLLLKAANTVKEEMNETMSAISNAEENDSTKNDADDADYAEAAKASESGSSTATASWSASFSTRKKPTMEDFKDWFVNGAMKTGMPGGVKPMANLSQITGSWKVFFFIDQRNEHDNKGYSYATMTFSGSDENIKMELKRYYTYLINYKETINDEEGGPERFSGKWRNNELIASGDGSFILEGFWEQDGKQYAVGTFNYQDGVTAAMALVRP